MAVRHGILALLSEGDSHGYQLKLDFEQRTGGAWVVNIGQIYSTLERLERDELVAVTEEADDRKIYAITAEGRAALRAWFSEPVVRAVPPRDELAAKVLFAIASPDADVAHVLQTQRTAAVEQLQEYTRLKASAEPDSELGWVLLLDSFILKAEAEVRWLDMCEARLRQRETLPPAAASDRQQGAARTAHGAPALEGGRSRWR